MTRNYDTTDYKLFPRVPEIYISYPANGTPQIRYVECVALIDSDGLVQHTVAGAVEHTLQLDKISKTPQCVDPKTGENISGVTTSRKQLMLSLLAFIREDQKLRESELAANTNAA